MPDHRHFNENWHEHLRHHRMSPDQFPPEWREHLRHRRRHGPPPHWIVMKVFSLIMGVSVIFCLIYLTNEGFKHGKFLQVLGITLLILCVSFFILSRLFRPMRMLMRAVYEISNGNLDFQFPANGRGEFNYLAKSFNAMAKNIKNMVESKSQLLLDVSHELRSPLTRAKLAVEMMPESKLRSSVTEDLFEMEAMLTDILETEKLKSDYGKLTFAELDLTRLIGQLLPKYNGRKPGLTFDEKQPVVIMADEARVKTVLQNLFENALKYSSEQTQPVQISLDHNEEAVLVKVKDFGVGVPLEDQAKVFEPFYRVDKSRTKETGGYGLGLSLCSVIMKAHGGEITLESSPGNGTTMTLTFPRSS